MIVKLLTEQHLEFLSLKRGCTGSSESTHVKMPHCWKSQVMAHFNDCYFQIGRQLLNYQMISMVLILEMFVLKQVCPLNILRPNKKISVFLRVFFWKKYYFIHFERHF